MGGRGRGPGTGQRSGQEALGLARRGLFLGGGALAGAALAACGGGEGGAGSGAQRVAPGTSVTYLAFHNPQELQIVQGHMQRWEQRHPGAAVEITNLPQAAMFEKLATMMAAGTPPDVIRSGGTQWAQYANLGGIRRDRLADQARPL